MSSGPFLKDAQMKTLEAEFARNPLTESAARKVRAEGGGGKEGGAGGGELPRTDISGQGLTLVHFSDQVEPFLTRNTPYTP